MTDHIHEWQCEDGPGLTCFAQEGTAHWMEWDEVLRRINAVERLPDPIRLRVFAEHILEDPPFLLDEVSAILTELAAALEPESEKA